MPCEPGQAARLQQFSEAKKGLREAITQEDCERALAAASPFQEELRVFIDEVKAKEQGLKAQFPQSSCACAIM